MISPCLVDPFREVNCRYTLGSDRKREREGKSSALTELTDNWTSNLKLDGLGCYGTVFSFSAVV